MFKKKLILCSLFATTMITIENNCKSDAEIITKLQTRFNQIISNSTEDKVFKILQLQKLLADVKKEQPYFLYSIYPLCALWVSVIGTGYYSINSLLSYIDDKNHDALLDALISTFFIYVTKLAMQDFEASDLKYGKLNSLKGNINDHLDTMLNSK